ncbi:MAG: hypothetical protein RLZZ350_676 [Verrucomicrobiota bacterium]|jgi:hypothetical protein
MKNLSLRSLAFTLLVLATFSLQLSSARAQGTAFTYQGSLNSSNAPASGSYDLQFALFNASSGGTQQGSMLTNAATSVSNGLFTVTLDFGSQFPGANRWLELAVRTNGGGAFTTLAPRQALTPTPYAIQSANATIATTATSANSVAAANISGTVSLAQLPGVLVTNNQSNATLNGTFSGNGAGLTNLNAVQKTGDTMTGTLNLPSNGLVAGGNQLVLSSGNLGIGTATPSAKLHVGGGTRFTVADIGSIFLQSGTGGSGAARDWKMYVPMTAGNLAFRDMGFDNLNNGMTNDALVIQYGTGNVGIGKTNPATALDVNGTVTATGFSGNGGGLTNLSVSSSQISGALTLAQLPTTVVTNGASGVSISGTFSGNGTGVTNVDFSTVNSYSSFSRLTNFTYGNFVSNASPVVGSSPQFVIAADVNGDGKLDLISANGNASSLTVLTNNGSGVVGLFATPGVGSQPQAVAAADVNGDGRLDLISANGGGNTLTVLTNNGNGFGFSATLTVGNNPRSVISVDVNGDGRADLVSANFNSGGGTNLTVLTNNGSGGFVLSATLTVGVGASSVTSADVNGDGWADLISANFNAASLTVLTNNGSGGFGLSSSPSVSGGSGQTYSVTSADVNGDGKVDLICANNSGNTLSVLTNNGSGGFTLGASLAIGGGAISVTTADINGDGKVDLIGASAGPNTLSVLTNNGSGGFVLASSPGVGAFPLCVTAADLNGDGKADLISANGNASTLTVLFNTPTSVTYSNTYTGTFIGNGAGLTNVTAASFSGTLADAQLSTNVALRNATQTFTGTNIFSNASNVFTGTFNGNGAGLTNLAVSATTNAASLTIGTLPDARLSVNVPLLSGSPTFAGTISGNGSGLNSLNAGNVANGTLAEVRLTANVALLNRAGQTFSGINNFSTDIKVDGYIYNLWSGVYRRLTGGATEGGTVTWSSSDVRLKQDIATIPDALQSISLLRGVTYHWNDTGVQHLTRNVEESWKSASGTAEDDQKLWAEKRAEEAAKLSKLQTGFIAQEVERVFPDWVRTDERGFKQIDMEHLNAVLVNAVKEQQTEIEALKARIARLEQAVSNSTPQPIEP